MTEQQLVIFATIRAKEEFIEDVRDALLEIIEPTLAEEGCYEFSMFENQEKSNVFHLFEIFRDSASLDEHYQKPYTKAVFEKYEGWLEEPVEVVKMNKPNVTMSGEKV